MKTKHADLDHALTEAIREGALKALHGRRAAILKQLKKGQSDGSLYDVAGTNIWPSTAINAVGERASKALRDVDSMIEDVRTMKLDD